MIKIDISYNNPASIVVLIFKPFLSPLRGRTINMNYGRKTPVRIAESSLIILDYLKEIFAIYKIRLFACRFILICTPSSRIVPRGTCSMLNQLRLALVGFIRRVALLKFPETVTHRKFRSSKRRCRRYATDFPESR